MGAIDPSVWSDPPHTMRPPQQPDTLKGCRQLDGWCKGARRLPLLSKSRNLLPFQLFAPDFRGCGRRGGEARGGRSRATEEHAKRNSLTTAMNAQRTMMNARTRTMAGSGARVKAAPARRSAHQRSARPVLPLRAVPEPESSPMPGEVTAAQQAAAASGPAEIPAAPALAPGQGAYVDGGEAQARMSQRRPWRAATPKR